MKVKSLAAARITVVLAVLCLQQLSTVAQSEKEKGLPFITNYSPKQFDALPQVWSVTEGTNGLMYFGVQNTILEYDGVKWRKVLFKREPVVVRSLARDADGKIYYGGLGDFGYLAHDSIGRTVALSMRELIPAEYRSFNDIWTINIASEGIYFQSREFIFRVDRNSKVRVWKPRAKFMYSFYLDDNYFVHEQGLGLFKMVSDSLQLIPGSEFTGKERMQVMLPYRETISKTSEKQYLIGLFYTGLYLFNGREFKPFNSEANDIIRANTLYKATKAGERYVLSTTGKGLVVIDSDGKIVQNLNRDVGLQDESVYAVYSDSRGILWLGLDNGISRVETSSPFTQFTKESGINTATLSIHRFNGALYLGTTNGLMVFDNTAGMFKQVAVVPPNQTFALVPYKDELMVPNDGLFAIKNKKATVVQSSIGGSLQLTGLYIAKAGNLMYGGCTFGVSVFARTPTGWKYLGLVPGLDDQIWTFAENADGSIWAGSQSGVVYKVFPFIGADGLPALSKFQFKRYGPEQGLTNAAGNVFEIKGQALFPTDSTILRFDEKTQAFVKETAFGEFPKGGGKDDFTITEDRSGRVWLRFAKQTIIATPQPDGKYRLDTTSLLPFADRTLSSIYPEDNGITWFCTTDGLIRFDERVKKNYDERYSSIIRHIGLGNGTINPYEDTNKKPELGYSNNALRFEYAAPFFEQEDKTKFQTWLEGFEEGWSQWDNNYYKEYTNLPPGSYKFHVKALNVYHKESEEAVYEFTILPPWWRSWWAITLYVLAGLGLIYMIIRWRTHQLHEKHRELEKLVEERTHELSNRVEELAVINSVQDGLAKELDLEGIYELVGEKMREIFKAQVIDIATYDAESNRLIDQYSFEKGDRSLIGEWEPVGFRKLVIQTGDVLLINENLNQKSIEAGSPVLSGELPLSCLFVPLKSGNEIKGMISLQDLDKEHAFTESDVRLLQTLANSMTVALENARLFDKTTRLLKETEQRNAELAVINSVQESLVAQLDMASIYELVGEKIRQIFKPQVIDIVTYEPRLNIIEDKYAYEKGDRTLLAPREPKGFRKHVIETGQLLLHNSGVEQAMKEYGNEVLIGESPKSQVYVPMVAGGKVTGIISLQNLDHENAFSESDVSLLTTLANSMSVALESARLFDETNRLLKETEQRNAELAVINSVQDSLVAQMEMESIYDLVGEKMREIFNPQVIDIVTYDNTTDIIEDKYSYEKGDRTLVPPRKPNGFRKHVIDTGQLLLHNSGVEEAMKEFGNQILVGETPKSQVYVPMVAAGKVTGVISLQNLDHENAFSESDVSLLTTLANSMSVALESARLFDETNRLLKETEQRTAELAVINNVQEELVREMNQNAIYEIVGEKICELFDTQTVLIRTFDTQEREHWKFAIEKGERHYSDPRPMIWANKQLVISKQPLLINEDYVGIAKKYGSSGVSMGKPPKSAMFVPMLVGDVVKGSVSLQNIDRENAFTDADLRILTTLTNSMSVALENARLFDETTHLLAEAKLRATELATVNNISKALAAQLDTDELIHFVGEQMRNLFNASIVYLALLNKKTKMISFPYQYGDDMEPMALGEGLTSKIILTGEPLLVNKDVQEIREQLGVQLVGLPAASYLGVPIPVGDEIIGVLSVQSTEQENRFNENDQRLLSTIAASVGVALNNATLFDEVKQAKLEAEAATKAAEKANEAKSAFLSTVSHELRTPLTSVLGFAKIIKKRLEEKIFPSIDASDPKTQKTITQISDNLSVVVSEGERLTHLINDVLDLAKIEAGKMEWNVEDVFISEVAERAISATTALFEQKNLVLEKDIEKNIPVVSGDRDKLIQVMINLISNAVKFTDSGKVVCKVYKKKKEVVVSITDTGIGIAPEDHGAVFEQFKQVGGDTLTDKPKGTGLGLPICKEIIEHHGGRIWLESQAGKGSTFFFSLPLKKSATTEHKPADIDKLLLQLREQMTHAAKSMGHRSTILIVDDDDSIRSLLQQELSDAGYLIQEAVNGKEAIEIIRKRKPDLIILDVMMPEMNGFDVAAILKNDPETMDIPIIILSVVQDKIRGYRIGVDRYLNKPIDTAQLFNEVGVLLEQGRSKKKVMIVDEDTTAVRTLTDVLETKGYHVVESNGKELMEKAIKNQPDIIILNSANPEQDEMIKTLRFEKGMENVLFLLYQ